MPPTVQLTTADNNLMMGKYTNASTACDKENCHQVAFCSWSDGIVNWHVVATQQFMTC